MPETPFQAGDRVIHQARPEWGVGEITKADHAMQDGQPCQSLTIRFDRVGTRTLSTALARLKPAPEGPSSTTTATLEPARLREQLIALPDACTDPFTDLTKRFDATAALYRYDAGKGLLEWATAMTGVADALGVLTRHEIELAYRDFAVARDNQLRRLATDLSRQSKAKAAAMVEALPANVRDMLRRGNVLR